VSSKTTTTTSTTAAVVVIQQQMKARKTEYPMLYCSQAPLNKKSAIKQYLKN
jgi:hypothetical protein